jgi:hypothetical protein
MNQKIHESAVAALIPLFNLYAQHGGNWDEKAALIADLVLTEIPFTRPWALNNGIVAGKRALELLNTLPPYKTSTLHVPDFRRTRRVLWEHVLEGLLQSDGEEDGFIQAIIDPGEISPHEEEVLKDCIKERLQNFGSEVVCMILKKHRATCAEVPFRALLHFLASKCPADQLKELFS